MNILLLDDNSHRITFFQNALNPHKVTICRHARTAIRALKDTSFDIIFLDHDLHSEPADPEDENCGSEVARFIADHDIDCPCIILHTENWTGRESMESILPHSDSIPYGKLKKDRIRAIVNAAVKKIATLES
ncbi:MAG: response regulator [Chloroflexota bacterium]